MVWGFNYDMLYKYYKMFIRLLILLIILVLLHPKVDLLCAIDFILYVFVPGPGKDNINYTIILINNFMFLFYFSW